MPDDLLSQGIAAVKAGNVQQARLLLDGAIRQNPNDERTWGWFYNVCENDEERIRCLRELLRINPSREKVKIKLGELTGFEPPLLSPKPQPVTPTRLSQPIQKVEKRGNHTWIWIGVLAILAIILCIGGIIVFGRFLISNPANIQPTVTNVPIVIDAPALFGKSVDEIRELYKVDESLPLQMIEPGTFSDIPSGSYWESYFFRKYNIDFFYDASLHVIAFDVFSGLVDDRIPITDWRTALKMLNINVTSLPDFCSHDYSGDHSCSSIDMSYLVLIWWNNNGHMIKIYSDWETNFVQNIYIFPPQVPSKSSGNTGIKISAIQPTFENSFNYRFDPVPEYIGAQPALYANSPDGLAGIELFGPSDDLISAYMHISMYDNATESKLAEQRNNFLTFLKLAVPEWTESEIWFDENFSTGSGEINYGILKITLFMIDLSDGRYQCLTIERLK